MDERVGRGKRGLVIDEHADTGPGIHAEAARHVLSEFGPPVRAHVGHDEFLSSSRAVTIGRVLW